MQVRCSYVLHLHWSKMQRTNCFETNSEWLLFIPAQQDTPSMTSGWQWRWFVGTTILGTSPPRDVSGYYSSILVFISKFNVLICRQWRRLKGNGWVKPPLMFTPLLRLTPNHQRIFHIYEGGCTMNVHSHHVPCTFSPCTMYHTIAVPDPPKWTPGTTTTYSTCLRFVLLVDWEVSSINAWRNSRICWIYFYLN